MSSAGNQYGKDHPDIVARNSAAFEDLRKDFEAGFHISSITGYTSPEGPMDPKGKFEGNTALSEERATAARDYIADHLCSLRRPGVCFVKEKDSVKLVRGGELHTATKNGKELEGEELAQHAVPAFLEKESATLTAPEQKALERKRSPLAQTEIVYPLLRRAEITLVKDKTETTISISDPGGTKTVAVDCPDYILTAAKAHFALKDALTGKKGP